MRSVRASCTRSWACCRWGSSNLLLREHLQKHPRLIFFMFLFAAWSAQLLLYFRQSRYYAFMVLGVIAAFYVYERYWRTKNVVYLALLTLVATLSFLNHYVGGAATMLSLAAWHLLFRGRETTGRDYLQLGLGSVVVVAVGSGYLLWLGVFDGERGGWLDYMGMPVRAYGGDLPAPLLRIQIYVSDLFTADWNFMAGVPLVCRNLDTGVDTEGSVARLSFLGSPLRSDFRRPAGRRGGKDRAHGRVVCAVFGTAVGTAGLVE